MAIENSRSSRCLKLLTNHIYFANTGKPKIAAFDMLGGRKGTSESTGQTRKHINKFVIIGLFPKFHLAKLENNMKFLGRLTNKNIVKLSKYLRYSSANSCLNFNLMDFLNQIRVLAPSRGKLHHNSFNFWSSNF